LETPFQNPLVKISAHISPLMSKMEINKNTDPERSIKRQMTRRAKYIFFFIKYTQNSRHNFSINKLKNT